MAGLSDVLAYANDKTCVRCNQWHEKYPIYWRRWHMLSILPAQPIDYFYVLCDSVFLENICGDTNKYASQLPQKIQGHKLLDLKI